jgi:DNA-binding MarR family transcriptional regulator
MQKELIEKLAVFGFTVNQAKVYLNIVQSAKTDVGQISKNTLLHRQDIYKLLPKLENMGLITRTIGKPVMIEALPIEKALERLITIEKEAADKKIAYLEKTLKELTIEIQQQPKMAEDTRFTLLTTSSALKNRINLSFKAKPGTLKIVSTTENLKGQAGSFYKQYFQMLANCGIKIQLMLIGAENPVDLVRAVEKLVPRDGILLVKTLEHCPSKDYQVVDGAEVWIATKQKALESLPVILWTNDANIVGTYLESFNEAWNNPKAAVLFDNANRQVDAIKALSTRR